MSKTSESCSSLVLENFIGGKFVSCGSCIDSYDPSTGEVYCRVPDSGKEEVGPGYALTSKPSAELRGSDLNERFFTCYDMFV